jgi:putative sterol carrier protein
MSDFDDIDDLASVDSQQYAEMVKKTPDSKITEALRGKHRTAILDAIFARMPERFRPDRAGSTSAVIHWNIKDRPDGGIDTYELVIANAACDLSPKPENVPTLSITLAPLDFIKISSGNANPVTMFLTGKLKATGDLGLAANISNLFDTPKP